MLPQAPLPQLPKSGAVAPSHWLKLFGEDSFSDSTEVDWIDEQTFPPAVVSDEESSVGKVTLFRFDDAPDGVGECGHRVLFSVRAEDEHPDLVDTTQS